MPTNPFKLPETEPEHTQDRPRILALAIFVALVVFGLDLTMPLGVAEAVPYVAVVLVMLRSPHPRDPLYAAVGCSMLTVIGFFLSPKGSELWLAEINRAMALFAIWVTAILANQMRMAHTAARGKSQILSGILRNMPTVAFHIGEDGFLRESVGKGLRRIGITGYESYGRNALEPPKEIVDRLLASGRNAPVFYESSGLYQGRPWWFWCCLIPEEVVGNSIIGFGLDITHLKQAERRLATHQAVTLVLVEADSIAQAYQDILQAICQSLHWTVGAIWEVVPQGGALHCVEIWQDPSRPVEAFVAETRELTFGPGVGLPGRVWKQGEPAWVVDVSQDSNFPRASVAHQVGLHGGFAFPVPVGSRVMSVMEFFSYEAMEPDQELVNMFTAFGRQLGRFIERKHKERRLAVYNAVARVLVEESPSLMALRDILEAIGLAMDWEVGMFWKPAQDMETLMCAEYWHRSSSSEERLKTVAQQTPLSPGVGLAGRAWKKAEPMEMMDVTSLSDHQLYGLLQSEGLHGGFAFPIRVGSQTLGVMEFFSRHRLDVDEELCNMFEAIGIQIGHFLEHFLLRKNSGQPDQG